MGKDMDQRSLNRLRRVARERFGWAELRPGQAEAMAALVEGRDVLAVMPTGAGKSAIYQVPALLLDGPTVVVSPLLALQRDQMAAVEASEDAPDAQAEAVRVSSEENAETRRAALDSVRSGDAEYLFCAPEQLANPEFVDRLAAAGVSLLAVDEAHCVSAWGHDFRPEYLRIGDVLDRLGRPVVVALTATASPTVREDVVDRLHLRDPYVLVHGFDRPNIRLAVRRFVDDATRRAELVSWVAEAPRPGLVYAPTRRAAEELSLTVAAAGLRCASYHGGMAKRRRVGVEQAFGSGELDVIVATSAFGMGVDYPNVRFVVHAAAPDSPDTYYQEVGRAGRDGGPATALLLYRPEDLGLQRYFSGGLPSEADLALVAAQLAGAAGPQDRRALRRSTGLGPRKLGNLVNLLELAGAVTVDRRGLFTVPSDAPAPQEAARLGVEEAERQRTVNRSRLEMMRGYAETTGCRRQFLLGYFGEQVAGPCGNCDTCESGEAAERAAADPDAPWPVSSRVRHEQWGEGVVMGYEPGRVVVLFDDVGYRTLALDVLAERELLTPA
jgi:ATP-dependent DNA helicase RecQ